LARNLIIEPDAIAVIIRDKDGKFRVTTNHHVVAGGASWGMFWDLLFGMLFFIPFLGMAGQLVPIDYTIWGCIHLGLAAIAYVTGFGLLLGEGWAWVVGRVLTVLNMIVAFAFMPAYPWWGTALIVFSLITMYAIVVHGNEVGDAYAR